MDQRDGILLDFRQQCRQFPTISTYYILYFSFADSLVAALSSRDAHKIYTIIHMKYDVRCITFKESDIIVVHASWIFI